MEARLLKTLIEKKSNEIITTNRLESLRLPRDLSLGGTKPKKIFVPNVGAARLKQKANNKGSIEKLDSKKKEKAKPQPKKKIVDSNRFVQSQGFFSEGSALQKRPTGLSDRTKCENNTSSKIAIPVYRKTEVTDSDEDNLITRWNELKCSKTEDTSDVWNYSHASSYRVRTNGLDPYFCKMEDAEANTRLALIKMPESLACREFSDNPTVTKLSDYNLNMMTEGKIGSLQITRSGKMFMKIGNMKYLMESIDTIGSPETVATYTNATEEHKAKFTILGDVEGKFEITPQWSESFK